MGLRCSPHLVVVDEAGTGGEREGETEVLTPLPPLFLHQASQHQHQPHDGGGRGVNEGRDHQEVGQGDSVLDPGEAGQSGEQR